MGKDDKKCVGWACKFFFHLSYTPLPMTDEQVNMENMARNVRQLLAKARPQWAPLYPKMVPDFDALG